MLTYTEANLFLRAGDDVRWDDWPQFSFIRVMDPGETLPGFVAEDYVPTTAELTGDKWRRL